MNDIKSLFIKLLSNNEIRKIDFKRDQYLLTTEHLKSEFVKDILCLANAPGDDGYLVLGVKAEKGNPTKIVGISNHHDGSDLEQLVNGMIEEPIQFEYHNVKYNGKECGLIQIPKSKAKLHWPKKDFGVLKKHVFYTRRGPAIREASKQVIRAMFIETMNISDVAKDKISKSLKFIDELKDYSLSQRFAEMHKIIKKLSPNLGIIDYVKIVNSYYKRNNLVCALFKTTNDEKREFAVFMYPLKVKREFIFNARYEIENLFKHKKNQSRKNITAAKQLRLKRSDLIHIAYGKINTSSLESRLLFSDYRVSNQANEPWGKIIKWENFYNKNEIDRALIYEFFLSNVISREDMQDRLEKLFLWVKIM